MESWACRAHQDSGEKGTIKKRKGVEGIDGAKDGTGTGAVLERTEKSDAERGTVSAAGTNGLTSVGGCSPTGESDEKTGVRKR